MNNFNLMLHLLKAKISEFLCITVLLSCRRMILTFFWSLISNFLKFVIKTNVVIYPLNHFKMYSSVVLTIFTQLCNRSLELFHVANRNSIPLEQLPICPSFHCLATTIVFSVFIILSTLDTSCKWNRKAFVPFVTSLFHSA